jgi:TRAP-type C4-dicarboxylate transport system permease large subunit
VMPFLVIDVFTLLLLIFIPEITLFLPTLMS